MARGANRVILIRRMNDSNPDSPPLFRGTFNSPFFWLAAFLILNISAAFFSIPTRAIAYCGAVALTFAYVCVVVFFAVGVARKKLSIPHILAWGVVALLVWMVLDNFIVPALSKPIIAAARVTKTRPGGLQLFELIALGTLTDAALMSLSVCAGNLASRLIRAPNMLGPICIVIALVDVWGVLFGGIVSQLLQKAPEIAARAMTSGPKLGAASSKPGFVIPLPDIGVGDYLFLGLLFGALFYLSLNWRDAINWVVPLVCAALLVITLFPRSVPPLPGLLFIGLGVAIPNYKTFQFTREEKFALLYAGAFVAVLTGVLYWGFKSVLPEKELNRRDAKPQGTTK
jgi:hypothetical protein